MALKFVTLPALVAAATLAASPAFAERRGGERHGSHHSERSSGAEHAQPRAQSRRPAQAPRVNRPLRVQQAPPGQQAPRYQHPPGAEGRVGPRATATPHYSGAVATPRSSPRYNSSYGHGNYGYARYASGNRYYYGGRYYATPWHGWSGYAPFLPYYFRPHLNIAFGVYVGYPVAYYAYPYPVPVYGYDAPPSEVRVTPSDPAYGGIALQIAPNDAVDDAAVYVDGTYAGVVSDFDGTRQPLTLTQGAHHLEIDHDGFKPLAFDVTVQPGMVTPYQGLLQPD